MNCITIVVTDNQFFQASPVTMYTVTLSSSHTRVTVGGSAVTNVIINDDDGELVASVMVSITAFYSTDVTASMVTSEITRNEERDVSVCAEVNRGLRQPVTVTFTATGQQTGTGMLTTD